MKFNIFKNYLFITYHWLNIKNSGFWEYEYYNKERILSIHNSYLGKSHPYGRKNYDFVEVDLSNDLFIENGESVNYKCFFTNERKTRGIQKTVYLFVFENKDIPAIIKSIVIKRNLEKILKKINLLFLDNAEQNNDFQFRDTSSILYLEPNINFKYLKSDPDNKLSEFTSSFRSLISKNSYSIPFVFKDVIIDNDILYVNTLKSFLIFGCEKVKPTTEGEFAPLGLIYFIDYMSIINLICRFKNEIQESDIYRLEISDYIENAIRTNNISNFFKNNYLKEKQKISSLRIEALNKTKSLIQELLYDYKFEDIVNLEQEDDISIDIHGYKASLKASLSDFRNGLVNQLEYDIDLIETKENILNDTFRDLTTITTNELNFMLQNKMRTLTIIAIFITVLNLLISFKQDFKQLFTYRKSEIAYQDENLSKEDTIIELNINDTDKIADKDSVYIDTLLKSQNIKEISITNSSTPSKKRK